MLIIPSYSRDAASLINTSAAPNEVYYRFGGSLGVCHNNDRGFLPFFQAIDHATTRLKVVPSFRVDGRWLSIYDCWRA